MSRLLPPCLMVLALLSAETAQAVMTVVRTQELSFGALLPGQSPGTVTVSSSADTARVATGGVTLFSLGGAGSRARFDISGGPASTVCTLELPLDGSVFVSVAGRDMAVNGFTSTPAATVTLNGLGAGTVHVGATLSVGSAQYPGTYSSSFSVTVICP